jgi:hypothetical protein
MVKIDFKHNLEDVFRDVLDNFSNTIRQNKKQLHQQAADVVKKDIQENVYDEAFSGVVNPNSTWQRLKAALGFPARPGHFTGSTQESLVAEATEEIGQIMLKGKWPDRAKQEGNSMRAKITPSGFKIDYFRDDKENIRVKDLFIPSEDFVTKQYGSWIDEDILFMKLRPEAEREVLNDMDRTIQREIDRILANFSKRF